MDTSYAATAKRDIKDIEFGGAKHMLFPNLKIFPLACETAPEGVQLHLIRQDQIEESLQAIRTRVSGHARYGLLLTIPSPYSAEKGMAHAIACCVDESGKRLTLQDPLYETVEGKPVKPELPTALLAALRNAYPGYDVTLANVNQQQRGEVTCMGIVACNLHSFANAPVGQPPSFKSRDAIIASWPDFWDAVEQGKKARYLEDKATSFVDALSIALHDRLNCRYEVNRMKIGTWLRQLLPPPKEIAAIAGEKSTANNTPKPVKCCKAGYWLPLRLLCWNA